MEEPPGVRLMAQQIAYFRRLRWWLAALLAGNLLLCFVNAGLLWGR